MTLGLALAAEGVRTLDHEAVLKLLLQLSVLLGSARLFGELFRKIGQPAVVGELLAGLFLGPTFLGQIFPLWQAWLFGPDPFEQSLLGVVSLLGVFTLLIVTGFEIDVGLIKHKARTAVTISLGGILVPMLCGLVLGYWLPDSCVAHPDQRLVFSLFIAVALSISAIPVIAKVLMDLKLLRRDIGQVTLAAAMLDDSVGWVLLAVAVSLAHQGDVSPQVVFKSLGAAATVMGLGLWLGRAPMARLLATVDNHFPGVGSQLSCIIVLSLAAGALTQFLELESVLGAFVVGILAGQAPRLQRDTAHVLELTATSFLTPIFFAAAGLKINLVSVLTPQLLSILLIILVVASFGKYFGCYLAGYFCGLSHWERLALGSGMNPRGAMGIIVASLGLSNGILTQEMYSILVAMAIVTSLLAPPLLRYTLARVEVGAEEAARLASEERESTSFVFGLRRILVPSRGGTNAGFAGEMMEKLSHRQHVEVTGLVVELHKPVDQKAKELKSKLLPNSRVKIIKADDPKRAIIDEARRGYSLLTLGATASRPGQTVAPDHTVLFNPFIDGILHACSCPVLITKAMARPETDSADEDSEIGIDSIRRILVPVVGTQYSLHATELIATIAAEIGAALTILRVIPPSDNDGVVIGQKGQELAQSFGQQLVDRHAELARHLNCAVETRIEEHVAPELVILQIAGREHYDMVMLSCHRQPLTGRTFLGHRVETILHNAPCAVAVLSSL